MDLKDFRSYLVVKILSQIQNDDYDEYGCIPKTWVKVRDHNGYTVVFGYPSEDRIYTKLRVIEYQPLDTTWPIKFGEVVFHTDSQEEAFRFLDTKTEHENNTLDQPKDTNEQDDREVKSPTSNTVTIKPIDQPKKKRGRPRKQKPCDQEAILQNENIGDELDKELELEILEAEKLIRTYESNFDDEEVVIPSMPNSSHNFKTPDTIQTRPSEAYDVLEESPVNNKIAKKITQRPRRKSTHQTLYVLEDYQGSSDDCDRSDDSDYTPEIVRPKLPSRSGQSVPARDQEISMNLLNNQIYSECYNMYVQLNDSYQKSMSILENAEDYLQNIISAHKDNVAAAAKPPSPSPTSHYPDAINSNMFSNPQPLLRERCASRISEEDTRWTVRYPEPGKDIIELMPNTVSSYRDATGPTTKT